MLGRERLKDTSLDYAPAERRTTRGHLGPVASPAVSAAAHWKEAESASERIGAGLWGAARVVPEMHHGAERQSAALQQAAGIRQAALAQRSAPGGRGSASATRRTGGSRRRSGMRRQALVRDWDRRIQDYKAACPSWRSMRRWAGRGSGCCSSVGAAGSAGGGQAVSRGWGGVRHGGGSEFAAGAGGCPAGAGDRPHPGECGDGMRVQLKARRAESVRSGAGGAASAGPARGRVRRRAWGCRCDERAPRTTSMG